MHAQALIEALEACQLACGECKSMSIESGQCDMVTTCELCMSACAQKVMSMRRPSFCSAKTCAKITALCKHMVQECRAQCRNRHPKCAKACDRALRMMMK